jgi:hypothetical protein
MRLNFSRALLQKLPEETRQQEAKAAHADDQHNESRWSHNKTDTHYRMHTSTLRVSEVSWMLRVDPIKPQP